MEEQALKVIIMGCSRVGGRLANRLDEAGHEVVVLDRDPYSFRWLSSKFKGKAIVGDGTDEDVLRKAEIDDADAFVSATEGDNRNVLAAQIAKHIFKVPKVVSRIYDPIRRDMYQELGLETFSSTTVMADLLMDALQR